MTAVARKLTAFRLEQAHSSSTRLTCFSTLSALGRGKIDQRTVSYLQKAVDNPQTLCDYRLQASTHCWNKGLDISSITRKPSKDENGTSKHSYFKTLRKTPRKPLSWTNCKKNCLDVLKLAYISFYFPLKSLLNPAETTLKQSFYCDFSSTSKKSAVLDDHTHTYSLPARLDYPRLFPQFH